MLLSPGKSRGANRRQASPSGDRVVIAVMGLGGRGTYLAEQFAKRPDAEIAYLCDPDSRRFARARKVVEEAQHKSAVRLADKSPKLVQDFRRIVDDRSVDALINATPDHWHALGVTLPECWQGLPVNPVITMTGFVRQAKTSTWKNRLPTPVSVFARRHGGEGRKMVEAARKYNRVVQVGMQSRSAPYVHKARQYIQSGKLGDIHLVRVFNMMQHPRQRNLPPALASQEAAGVPEGFDYDLWCGPAPKLPYNPRGPWLGGTPQYIAGLTG